MNPFQINLTKLLVDMVSPGWLGDTIIEITKDPNEVTVEVRLVDKSVSFWIYDDGAQISGPNMDDRYEIEDYKGLHDLGEMFLKRAGACIALLTPEP